MGCGISTMNGNDASPGRPHFKSRFRHQNIIAPPIMNHNDNKYNYETIDDDGRNQEATRRDEGFNGERLKEKRRDQEERNEKKVFINKERQGKLKENNTSNNNKNVATNYEDEENNNNRDDWFIGPGSPSFREYCNDYDSADRSSMGDSNDYPHSGESTKNSSDEDSTKPVNSHSEKEVEKKERRGHGGFRNAMHKGKGRGGKRNILNFACYNSNTQSYAEGSFNKVVDKTT